VRALTRLDELYAIGSTRAGYSAEENAAHELAARWMREAGLDVGRDDAGNLFGRRGAARLWSGSHLDTVPNGGRFDGALGVVAAIEAAGRLRDTELGVVAFRAEETGPMGSRRLAELPDASSKSISSKDRCWSFSASRSGSSPVSPARRGARSPSRVAPRTPGPTPIEERADALVEAAKFVLHVRESARHDGLATVGALEVVPGATNVVPERVTVSVDARAPTADGLEKLIESIGFEPSWRQDPIAWAVRPSRLSEPCSPARRSSSPAPATTRWCSPPPACRRRCCSSAR
jgi:acetylornithine deacetylase/succinyl-diaminopimelate desuccinylase-like protein